MKIRMVPIRQVKRYPNNPRKPNAAVAKVRASLQEFGFKQPIVVDKDMVIIVGHTRHQAATELGMERVPVLVAEDLTPEQCKAYRITDNRSGEEAEFDPELLRVEVTDLAAAGFNMDALTFDAAELETYLTPADITGTGRLNGGTGNHVISYSLIFEDERQQAVWFDFLRLLKRDIAEGETIAARLVRHIHEQGHGQGQEIH